MILLRMKISVRTQTAHTCSNSKGGARMCDEHDATGSDLCWHHRAHTKQPSLSFQLGMDASPCDFMPSVSVLHARFVIPSYFRQKPLINVRQHQRSARRNISRKTKHTFGPLADDPGRESMERARTPEGCRDGR